MSWLRSFYDRLIFPRPVLVLLLFGALLLIASLRLDQFRLDASAESLVLEDDRSLEQYREVNRRFTTSDDFLVVTYTPDQELFSNEGLALLASLRDELAALENVMLGLLSILRQHVPSKESRKSSENATSASAIMELVSRKHQG